MSITAAQARISCDSAARFDYVDVLRGVAILMVILKHASESVPGLSAPAAAVAGFGQMGVQLFFVVSAYTLCLTATRRSAEAYPLLSFFIRRAFRIAPLYYLGVALYFAIHIASQYFANPNAAIVTDPYTPRNVLANLAFVHGFVPAANNNIVPGGWSIGTEMAFYLAFPQLLALLYWLAARSASSVLLAGGLALLLNLGFQVGLSRFTGHVIHNDNFTYFNLINQLPVFLLGMYAFFQVHGPQRLRWVRWRAPHALVLLLALSLAIALWRQGAPLAFALIPTVCAAAFVALLHLVRLARRPIPGLAAIGRASYSMYVLHFAFAWYLTRPVAERLESALPPELVLLVAFGVSTGLTYLLARLSERWIESKGIELGRRLIQQLQRSSGRRLSRAESPPAGRHPMPRV